MVRWGHLRILNVLFPSFFINIVCSLFPGHIYSHLSSHPKVDKSFTGNVLIYGVKHFVVIKFKMLYVIYGIYNSNFCGGEMK